MKELYICYDGVDCDITYHDTEEQAFEKLKTLVSDGLDCGEWMDGVERCFVAKITHCIDMVAMEADEDEGIPEDCFDMRIKEKCAI